VTQKAPDFSGQNYSGKQLSLIDLRGKLVVLDFWATWCGPCRVELPNVLKTYGKYHDKGFEIIGISLDQDQKQLESFVKDKKMTWPQFFDGKGWQNKLAQKYGVNSIPATYLLDGDGKIIAKDLRGEELEAAIAKALAKK
jgi:peroxiredoxin